MTTLADILKAFEKKEDVALVDIVNGHRIAILKPDPNRRDGTGRPIPEVAVTGPNVSGIDFYATFADFLYEVAMHDRYLFKSLNVGG